MTQQWQHRLAIFDRTFDEVEDDFEDFDAEIVAVPLMNRASYEAFLARRNLTTYGKAFASFRNFAASELIPAHLQGSVSERSRLVETIARYPRARRQLWRLMAEYRWRLQKALPGERVELLRTLLRLAVLDEEELDEVETANILTSAWGDAEDAGLDPAEYFAEAAELAGTSKLTHGQTARELLREFEPLDYGNPRERRNASGATARGRKSDP